MFLRRAERQQTTGQTGMNLRMGMIHREVSPTVVTRLRMTTVTSGVLFWFSKVKPISSTDHDNPNSF